MFLHLSDSVHGGRGLCPGRGSLSREGVSVQGGGLCPGGSLSGESLSRKGGGLSRGVLSGRPPCTVTCGRYTFYWNAFLFFRISTVSPVISSTSYFLSNVTFTTGIDVFNLIPMAFLTGSRLVYKILCRIFHTTFRF